MSRRKKGQPAEGHERNITREETRQLATITAGATEKWRIGYYNDALTLMTGTGHKHRKTDEMLACLERFWRDPAPMGILATRLDGDLTAYVTTRSPRFGGISAYIRTLIRTDRSRLENNEYWDGEYEEDDDDQESKKE